MDVVFSTLLATLLPVADAAATTAGDSTFLGIEWGVPAAIGLLAIGFVLVFAEVFIPSGGALGVAAVLCVVGSIVAAFTDGLTTGILFLVAVLVLTPLVVVGAFKVFPYTPIGRRMINTGDQSDERERRAVVHEEKALLGQVGIAVTPLRPAGQAEIAGDSRDVVTQGEMLDASTPVQVIEVSGNRIIVRGVRTTV